ncbi:MAG: O-antigen ligase family protein [Labilithrix sp.]|nr:O-antigen ligase family protein [Labilithrix sp.]MCW5814747.1 O-antigen ligase family protein [Labilithrix sp.]
MVSRAHWLLALIVPGAVLALGAIHTEVLCVVAAAAALVAFLVAREAEPVVPRTAATTLVVVAVVLIAWTALQLVPLPSGVLGAIASSNADVWARSLNPLREDAPAFGSISLDPTASRVQLLRGVTYLSVFIAAHHVTRRQDGVAFLERLIVASAVLLAAAALLHPVIGARRVFGVYEPRETLAYDPDHLGPLLNTNHLAAYANVGAILAFGSAVERRGPVPRVLAVIVVLLLGATTVWSLSRGGIATLAVGLTVVGLLTLRQRRHIGSPVFGPAAVAAAAVVGAAVFYLAAFDEALEKFAHNDLMKLDLARNAFELLRSYGVFGVGRGAFESVFPEVRTGTEYWVFTHPENVLAQWTTEWGIPVAVGALGALGWALRPRTVLTRSRPPIAAWAVLVASALHNLVDFSSEVPGVMLPLILCAAIVVGGRGSDGSKTSRVTVWARRPRLSAALVAGATVVGIAATLPFVSAELYREERSFRDVALDTSIDRAEFRRRARAVMLRHPAEAYFPYAGMVRALVHREDSVVPWAARALDRSPIFGRAHLLLARAFYVRSPAQARLEYRLACTQDSRSCALGEAARLVTELDHALELVPEGDRAGAVLEELATLLGKRLPASVVVIDQAILARDPNAIGPWRRIAMATLGDVRDKEPWCEGVDRGACIEEGLAAATRVRALSPERCEGHELGAQFLVEKGELDRAFTELEDAAETVLDRSACGRALVSLSVRTGQRARVDTALDRLLRAGCEAPPQCVENLLFAAEIEAQRGGTRRALSLTKSAAERAPEREDLLVRAARLAEAQHAYGDALDAYTRLAARHPEDAALAAAVARQRDALARGVLKVPPP